MVADKLKKDIFKVAGKNLNQDLLLEQESIKI